ncbi:MAG: carboxypeptidase regulatory-like domain-containing protein [Deltaproteobacteria bacterium]|nr:carboxypeptidase regulatory-like domain-containing protein [Deltaproteobacteria bacterium]
MMKRTVLSMIGFLLCLLFSACSGDRDQSGPAKESEPVKTEAAAPTVGDQGMSVQPSGTISGRVLFKGKHVAATLAVGKDKEICGNTIEDPRLLVSARGEIGNAVVRITEIAAGKAAAGGDVVLDQRKCEFVPHVLAITAGTPVKITNSDGILHNIHTLSKDNPAFNRAQPKYLKEITQTFSKPEIIPVRCDVHGWMSGWIFVASNPYFDMTGVDGTFKLAAVPPGKYTLEVWHETLGKQTQQVEVAAGQSATVEFEFEPKK